MFTRVLLAYDGRPPAEKAFDYILKFPLGQRAELAILAVIKPSSFALDYAAQTILDNAAGDLSGRMAQLQRRAQFAGRPTTTIIRIGSPVEQILRAARQWPADLIVTGKGASGMRLPWPWGSVSRQLQAQAPCRVVVVNRA